MLYDAKGNLNGGTKRERSCSVLGKQIPYVVTPAREMEPPYATFDVEYIPHSDVLDIFGDRKEMLVLTKSKIKIGEDVPENIWPVMAAHEYLHISNDLNHMEIFPYELQLARELGVEEDYIRFMASKDVFRNVANRNGTNQNDSWKPGMCALKDNLGADVWVKTEDDRFAEMYEPRLWRNESVRC
jgi:hypothetical protein